MGYQLELLLNGLEVGLAHLQFQIPSNDSFQPVNQNSGRPTTE